MLQINSDLKFDDEAKNKDMLLKCDDKHSKLLLCIKTFTKLFFLY